MLQTPSSDPLVSAGGGSRTSLGEIAGLVRDGSGAMVCAIAWDSNERSGAAFAPEQPGPWRELAQTILAALAQRTDPSRMRKSERQIVLGKSELATLLDRRSASAAACARCDGAAQVRIAIVAPVTRSLCELGKVAELGCRAALADLCERDRMAALAFWRRQGAEAGEQSARALADLADHREREKTIAELIGRASTLPRRARFTALGKMLAGGGPFEEWMIALAGPRGLEVFSSRPVTRPHAPRDFKRASRQPLAIVDGNVVLEARFMRRPYVCLPFESGAIVLSSRSPVSEAGRAQLSETIARLAPVLKSWSLEAELEAQRALTRRLAYRMFNAVADERARIARDLHDDHAQLITATRVALQGGGDQARAILQRIEHEVRRKLRELKPASLGRMSLARALSLEAARLNHTGIEMTLSGAAVAARLSRPAQNLCWQFAREALANVIRHSHATRVELSLARKGGFALISVTDNGRGIAAGALDHGSGISGMRERLSLIGGCVRIDSRPGATVLTAEIPDPL